MHEFYVGVSKKTEKPRKQKKNRTVKNNRLNRLKFWKNQPIRFRFYKPKTEKTEPNRTQTEKKPEPNQAKPKNRAKPVFVLKNWTETDRFEPVSVFFKKNFGLVTFFL
jgi:hypothetical protein